MPFANYGFLKYTRDEWTVFCNIMQLKVEEVNIIKKPEAILKGNSYPVNHGVLLVRNNPSLNIIEPNFFTLS